LRQPSARASCLDRGEREIERHRERERKKRLSGRYAEEENDIITLDGAGANSRSRLARM
jgi:hypothetical protein